MLLTVEFCDYGCMSVCDVPSRQSVILSLTFVLFSGEWGAAVPVPVHRNLICNSINFSSHLSSLFTPYNWYF